ncbi:hypothetical protein AA0472_2858 [Acetobacter estunensis NRIC 0472]|uniref:NAD(P)-binding domain-containing protein n=1 Tax=Acetobacter estunensis TaxID=104097 RepID=UPI001A7EFDEA|nr:NmrA family NAD(P)-binding protein [Acetobacter estunensis]GBQ28958.1 hypothetical protein AA0472_2858 [Acetobacter estunensis NRIC 0472]
MHVILGATGHVGSMVATALLQADRKVGVITRDPTKAAAWREGLYTPIQTSRCRAGHAQKVVARTL